MIHQIPNNVKKRAFFAERIFTPFIFLFLLSDWRNERETERRSPFFFCFDRPFFANVHLDVALIVTSFSAQLKEDDRKKGNCKFTTIQIPLWRLQTYLLLDFFSFFFLLVWSYFYTSLHCDCAQSSTIKKVVLLRARVAIYAYFERNTSCISDQSHK